MSEWTAQCAEALSADGLLARQMQGFAFRESQQALSKEIARAIEDRVVQNTFPLSPTRTDADGRPWH